MFAETACTTTLKDGLNKLHYFKIYGTSEQQERARQELAKIDKVRKEQAPALTLETIRPNQGLKGEKDQDQEGPGRRRLSCQTGHPLLLDVVKTARTASTAFALAPGGMMVNISATAVEMNQIKQMMRVVRMMMTMTTWMFLEMERNLLDQALDHRRAPPGQGGRMSLNENHQLVKLQLHLLHYVEHFSVKTETAALACAPGVLKLAKCTDAL